MNLIKLRGVLSCVFLVLLFSLSAVFIFKSSGADIMSVINKDDYVFYAWVSMPAFLLLPVIICADVFFLCLLLPYRAITTPFLLKCIIPMTIYGTIALIVGFAFSFVVAIYPLSTDYYQCDHSGIMSGSHYAKSKQLCEQMKYSSR